MGDHLAELLKSPSLPEASKIIQEHLEQERLDRERFYEEIRSDQKAEFINGEVVMSSPATNQHIKVLGFIANLIGNFVHVRQPDGLVCGEKALCEFPRNSYEPDLCYFGPEKAALIGPETVKHPVPDFVVEVLSPSTAERDRGIKFEDYAAHGVGEYWIVEPEQGVLEQYVRNERGAFDLSMKSSTGEVTSHVIEGLSLPVGAFFDQPENLAALRTILASA